jgi:hypothetical protein
MSEPDPPITSALPRRRAPFLTLLRTEDGGYAPQSESDRRTLDELCPDATELEDLLDAAAAERVCVVLRTDLAPEAV